MATVLGHATVHIHPELDEEAFTLLVERVAERVVELLRVETKVINVTQHITNPPSEPMTAERLRHLAARINLGDR